MDRWKKAPGLFLVVAAALAVGWFVPVDVAKAGAKNGWALTAFCMNGGSGPCQVYGSVADVRQTPDVTQSLSCSVIWTNGQSLQAQCSATTSAGVTFGCSITNTVAVQIAGSIGTDSYVYFAYPSPGAACNYIFVTNGSWTTAKYGGLAN